MENKEGRLEISYKVVTVKGLRVGYREAGSGNAIVLLHGVGESSFCWQDVMLRLACDHRVLALDLPGSGESDPSPGGYSSHVLAAWIADFMNAIEVDQAVIAGNSYGGLLALRFALAWKERVEALVLADSAGLGVEINPMAFMVLVPGLADVLLGFAMHPFGAAQRAWLRRHLYFAAGHRAPLGWLLEQSHLAQNPAFTRATVDSLRAGLGPFGQSDLVIDRLHEVCQPVLIVWGEQDAIVPVAHGRRAARLLPNGRCRVIPDCGHMPELEQPEVFVRLVEEFLHGKMSTVWRLSATPDAMRGWVCQSRRRHSDPPSQRGCP
jgi:pimeloyl-ACP methyl ester carboxylesterase